MAVGHCASESGVHRHDVEVALGRPTHVNGDLAVDPLVWTTDYVFGLIQSFRNSDPFPPVQIHAVDEGVSYVVGDGDPTASLTGGSPSLTQSERRARTNSAPLTG